MAVAQTVAAPPITFGESLVPLYGPWKFQIGDSPEDPVTQGHLFGFERIHDLLCTKIAAADLATAAQEFGKEDDISVISVTRTAGLEPAGA
jgi:hypothetical protein